MIDPSSSEEEEDAEAVPHQPHQRNRHEPPGYPGHLEVPNATPR